MNSREAFETLRLSMIHTNCLVSMQLRMIDSSKPSENEAEEKHREECRKWLDDGTEFLMRLKYPETEADQKVFEDFRKSHTETGRRLLLKSDVMKQVNVASN
jgi:hypothetical protein